MRARLVFYAIALAFLVWLAYAVLAAPSGGEPSPTDPSTTGPEPTAPATTTVTDTTEVRRLQGELHAERQRRRRLVRATRRRLAFVIRHAVSSGSSWWERSFACVHAGEGAWTSDTGNGYFGGLQMDLTFQRSYAPWALRVFGTADNWPVAVQISTAIQAAVSGRGFQPWPNTARACGLLP